MRSFRLILGRHAGRYFLAKVVLGAVALLLFNWAFFHEYPTQRRIVLYSAGWFFATSMATLSGAWMEWRRSERPKIG